MFDSQRMRWTILLSALVATIVAIFYPVDEFDDYVVAADVTGQSMTRVVSALPKTIPVIASKGWSSSSADPFAMREWQPLPEAVAEVDHRHIEHVEVAQAPVEPVSVPLPYKFLGQMQNGGQRILYLGRGDHVLLAQKGDVLESSYKVLDVSDVQVDFESVQTGLRQSLPIPGQ